MTSEFQQRKLKYFFGLLDANKNGHIQLEDFQDIVENLVINLGYSFGGKDHKFLVEKSVKVFHRLLKDISVQGGQVISVEEWIRFFDERIISPGNEDLLEEYAYIILGLLFDLFDENRTRYGPERPRHP